MDRPGLSVSTAASAALRMAPHAPPRLIADISGTVARFVLQTAPGCFTAPVTLPHDAHGDVQAALRTCLALLPAGTQVAHAAVVVANPADADPVPAVDGLAGGGSAQLRQQLRLDTLLVVPHASALVMSLPRLDGRSSRQVGGGQATAQGALGLLSGGSGLQIAGLPIAGSQMAEMQMAGLLPAAGGWQVLRSHAGEASVAPRDARETVVLRHAWQQLGLASYAQLLSEPGLVLVHQALAAHAGTPVDRLSAPEITRAALAGSDRLCADSVELFCAILGTAAAQLALTLDTVGGLYIGGGLVTGLGSWFDRSPFRRRFEDQGRASQRLSAIPTHVITAEHACLIGAAAMLDARCQAMPAASAAPDAAILAQIRRACSALSPAELRVAQHVLAHPRAVLNQPIVEIAKAAQVSQPTVIRFCRSLGCEGLSDFKLRLASGLTGTVPITHMPVLDDDSSVELGSKVLGNAASAILQVRSQLNRDMIDRGIALLLQASRVEFYSAGQDAGVAVDAQCKLLHLGIPSAAHTGVQLQRLAAAVLKPGDVAVLVCSNGRTPALLEVADQARACGAALLAITASQSPLARKADTVLAVEHVDDGTAPVSMVGRILQLLMVDILAVGVAMRRPAPPAPDAQPPGHAAAGPLPRVPLHSR